MSNFEWGNIFAISWIIVVSIAFIFMIFGKEQKRKKLRSIIDARLISLNIKGVDTSRNTLKSILILFSLFLLVIALMEPKYDFSWETINRKGIDIIVALDISKSMLASDILPSRFERSVLEIKNLINNLNGDRIGLVLFTSKAITQCPLTLDYATYKTFLDEVEIGTLPKGGTSLSSAIEEAIESFDLKYRKHRVLIIVTDGESHDTRLQDAISKANEHDISIFSIGIGSNEGAQIPMPSKNGEQHYVKDKHGNFVLSKLDEKSLIDISLKTGGAYIHATSSNFSLEKIYAEKIAILEGRELEMKRKKRFKHRFYIPLGIAVILLLLEALLSERK